MFWQALLLSMAASTVPAIASLRFILATIHQYFALQTIPVRFRLI
jgi:hypothetical protein